MTDRIVQFLFRVAVMFALIMNLRGVDRILQILEAVK